MSNAELPTILIVEDEFVPAKDLENQLVRFGYHVHGLAGSGDLAARIFAEKKPEIVLMDIGLQGDMDGFETARLLRSLGDFCLIMMTAHLNQDSSERMLNLGPHGFLTKPILNHNLKLTVELAWKAARKEKKSAVLNGLDHISTVYNAGKDHALLAKERDAPAKGRELVDLLMESAPEGVALLDAQGRIRKVNAALADLFQRTSSSLEGEPFDCFVHSGHRRACQLWIKRLAAKSGGPNKVELRLLHEPSRYFWAMVQAVPAFEKGGPGILVQVVNIDRARKRTEELLGRLARQKMEIKSLREAVTGIQNLLDHQEGNIMATLSKLVLPYLDKMKTYPLTLEQHTYLDIIDMNLRHVTSSYASRLSAPNPGLTPTELRIAEMIRLGQNNKDISRTLRVSNHTVSFHRRNIRRKLGICNKKINLTVYLQSLMYP